MFIAKTLNNVALRRSAMCDLSTVDSWALVHLAAGYL
jgi:hypothetical protein